MKTRPDIRCGYVNRGDVITVLRNLGLGWIKARFVAGGFMGDVDRICRGVGSGMESTYVSQAWDKLVTNLGLKGVSDGIQ